MQRAIELALGKMSGAGRGGPIRRGDCEGWRGSCPEGNESRHLPQMIPRRTQEKLLLSAKLAKNWEHFSSMAVNFTPVAKPCPMCLGAIYWARPAGVILRRFPRQNAAAAQFDDAFYFSRKSRSPRVCEEFPCRK